MNGRSRRRTSLALIGLGLLQSLIGFNALALTTVSGTVTEEATGQPVAEASVDLIFNHSIVASTTTNQAGSYSIEHPVVPAPGDALAIDVNAYPYFDDYKALDGSPDHVHLDVRLEKLPEITGSVHLPGGGIPPINSFLTQSVLVNGTWQDAYPQIRIDGSYSAPSYPGVSYRLCTGGIEMGALVQCFDHINQADQGADLAFSPIVLQPHEICKGTDFDLVEGRIRFGALDRRTRLGPTPSLLRETSFYGSEWSISCRGDDHDRRGWLLPGNRSSQRFFQPATAIYRAVHGIRPDLSRNTLLRGLRSDTWTALDG